MSKENLSKLATELVDSSAGMSEAQKQLLQNVEQHIHNWDEPDPIDPSLMEMFEIIIVDIENDHPKASAIAKRCIEILGSIGV